MLRLYCNSLAIQNTNQLQFMILLAPKPLRNQELEPGTELEIHSSNMQSHLGRCHNLHLGLKAQCEPAENIFLICWIIRQMLLLGTTSKGTCWQSALKAMAPARHIAGGGMKSDSWSQGKFCHWLQTRWNFSYNEWLFQYVSTRLWVFYETFMHRLMSIMSNNEDAGLPKEYN